MSEVTIRMMHPDEFDETSAVSVAAFGDDESIRVLLQALRESWAWSDELAFVAVRAGEIVGQVLYSTATLDAPQRLVDVLVLSPIGVRPDLHNCGIGSQLMTESFDALAGRSEPAVFLEGNPEYYSRFGFVAAATMGFTKPSVRIPDAAFQVRPLDRYTEDLEGALVYPDAFWRTDSVGLR